MVYSAPYSRWKDLSNFIFLGGISGEGEEKRYSGFGVCNYFVEAAQTRRHKRDQRIHLFNRRRSSSVWASSSRPWSETWAVSYWSLHWKEFRVRLKERIEKHFKLLINEKKNRTWQGTVNTWNKQMTVSHLFWVSKHLVEGSILKALSYSRFLSIISRVWWIPPSRNMFSLVFGEHDPTIKRPFNRGISGLCTMGCLTRRAWYGRKSGRRGWNRWTLSTTWIPTKYGSCPCSPKLEA